MCSQVVWHVNVEGMVMYDVHLRPAIPFKPNIKTEELLGSLLNPFKVFSTSTLTKLEIHLQQGRDFQSIILISKDILLLSGTLVRAQNHSGEDFVMCL